MDYQAGGDARSTTAYASASGAPAPRGPFSVELRDRLGRLSGFLGETNGQLADVRLRVIGCWPEEAPDGAVEVAPSKGAALTEEVLGFLDHLIQMARRGRDHAEVLANHI